MGKGTSIEQMAFMPHQCLWTSSSSDANSVCLYVCSVYPYRRKPAVRNPVGNVNADIQKTFGGCKVDAHFVNISILWTKSRVQDANGLDEGYAGGRGGVGGGGGGRGGFIREVKTDFLRI